MSETPRNSELVSATGDCYLTKPSCSGIAPYWVAMPARTQVEPRLLEQRTLTKSRGPTMFPGGAAAFSCVITVSFPIFWRICAVWN